MVIFHNLFLSIQIYSFIFFVIYRVLLLEAESTYKKCQNKFTYAASSLCFFPHHSPVTFWDGLLNLMCFIFSGLWYTEPRYRPIKFFMILHLCESLLNVLCHLLIFKQSVLFFFCFSLCQTFYSVFPFVFPQ